MTKWILILTTWYILTSEAGDGWKYYQIVRGIESEAACVAMAEAEGKKAADYTLSFTDFIVPRAMPIVGMTYYCGKEGDLK